VLCIQGWALCGIADRELSRESPMSETDVDLKATSDADPARSDSRVIVKIKGGAKVGAVLLVWAYSISFLIMSSYYCWLDIKGHDSFFRSVFWSPVVGAFKGTHWPYYAFFTGPKLSASERDSVAAFFACYGYLHDFQKLALSFRWSTAQSEDLGHLRTLVDSALVRLSECDSATLNSLHAGWGDTVDRTLRPAFNKLDDYLAGRADSVEMARVDALLAEFDSWLYDNWNLIGGTVGH